VSVCVSAVYFTKNRIGGRGVVYISRKSNKGQFRGDIGFKGRKRARKMILEMSIWIEGGWWCGGGSS